MDKQAKIKLGRRIVELRRKRKIPRRALANSLAVHYNTLQQIETGEHAPSLGVALAISRRFGITLDWLAGRRARVRA